MPVRNKPRASKEVGSPCAVAQRHITGDDICEEGTHVALRDLTRVVGIEDNLADQSWHMCVMFDSVHDLAHRAAAVGRVVEVAGNEEKSQDGQGGKGTSEQEVV